MKQAADTTPASTDWSHDALANDLAGHLLAPDRMVWTDMQLGRSGSPRPDVYTINKSYVNPCPMAYECKISVSDFRADVTVGKWSSYLAYAHAVTFAVPAGLVSKSDVPEMCGLIVRHENAWRMAKRATVNPRPIDQEALIKLLIDGVNREGPKARAKQWRDGDVTREFTKRFGVQAARYVGDAAETHRRIEQAEHHAKQIRERAEEDAKSIRERVQSEAPAKWLELLAALGLQPDADRWHVDREIRRLRDERDGTREARALRSVLVSLDRLVQNNREFREAE